MKEFKIRSSKSNVIKTTSLTVNQEFEIKELSAKEKITEKQQIKLDSLIQKKNNPELTQGSKTYCELWLKEQLYKRKKEFSNKYTQKGNIAEDESVDFICEQLGFGMLFKNEDFFENDFIQGTPDILTTDLVIDVKNSWDFDTFPLFEKGIPNNDYFGQLQCYMKLTSKRKAKLIYVLSDTPMNLIEKQAYYWCKDNGFEELDLDIYKEFIRKMTYNDVPDSLKIKVFDIYFDQVYIDQLEKGVKLCRNYIEELIKNISK